MMARTRSLEPCQWHKKRPRRRGEPTKPSLHADASQTRGRQTPGRSSAVASGLQRACQPLGAPEECAACAQAMRRMDPTAQTETGPHKHAPVVKRRLGREALRQVVQVREAIEALADSREVRRKLVCATAAGRASSGHSGRSSRGTPHLPTEPPPSVPADTFTESIAVMMFAVCSARKNGAPLGLRPPPTEVAQSGMPVELTASWTSTAMRRGSSSLAVETSFAGTPSVTRRLYAFGRRMLGGGRDTGEHKSRAVCDGTEWHTRSHEGMHRRP